MVRRTTLKPCLLAWHAGDRKYKIFTFIAPQEILDVKMHLVNISSFLCQLYIVTEAYQVFLRFFVDKLLLYF